MLFLALAIVLISVSLLVPQSRAWIFLKLGIKVQDPRAILMKLEADTADLVTKLDQGVHRFALKAGNEIESAAIWAEHFVLIQRLEAQVAKLKSLFALDENPKDRDASRPPDA